MLAGRKVTSVMVQNSPPAHRIDLDPSDRRGWLESLAIQSRRLKLVPMTLDVMRAILAGDWPEASRLLETPIPEEWRRESWEWLRHHAVDAEVDAERDSSSVCWVPRLLLLERAGDGGQRNATVVGEAGFHGPPDREGEVEIGYMVVAEHRRQGYAEEAVGALLTWAATARGVTRFKGCVDPLNVPSINLLRKLGFAETGRRRDGERGEQLIFRCSVREWSYSFPREPGSADESDA